MNLYMQMEYCDVTMKTRTNTETCRCSYKGFKWSKHSQNVSCGSFYNAYAEKGTTLMNETSAFQLFIFSHLEVFFIFSFHSERALHIEKKSSIRLACRTYVRTHHKTLSCLLLCCIFEGSKTKAAIYVSFTL